MTDSRSTTRKGAPRVRLPSAQRRESILTAATEVFAESGYRRGKVSEVAARLGVSEPVVFQNFGSKAALFAAVLDGAVTQVRDALNNAVGHGTRVSELLAAFLAPDHMDRFHTPGSLGFLFADASSLTAEPGVDDTARHALQELAEAFANLLRIGQRDGDIRPDLDPTAGAWWLMSMLSARTFRAAVIPDQVALEARLTAMTLNALTTRERSAEP
ncbi:TetR/AcrR family transcriptional regulator [Streptomyces sp. NBC_00322]|uniref:TetR/AcrR family transcriptional regulator n=1 Tax=Streptomyces sp. NBC_00322 TaxID=2975712 RepID=UPI002E2BA87F|nr:TetR/AcrR family transcriptional regulator [Streptomyces sp. NBC_00322]